MKSGFKYAFFHRIWAKLQLVTIVLMGVFPLEGYAITFMNDQNVEWEIRRFECTEIEKRCVHEIIENKDQFSEIESISLVGDWNGQFRDTVGLTFQNVRLRESFVALLQRLEVYYTPFLEKSIMIFENRSSTDDQWELIFEVLDEIVALPAELRSEIWQLLWHKNVP